MSLTINQEKQIRALKQTKALIAYDLISGKTAPVNIDTYVALAGYIREYRSLEKKWGEKATARREVLLKEIDLCLAVLDEK